MGEDTWSTGSHACDRFAHDQIDVLRFRSKTHAMSTSGRCAGCIDAVVVGMTQAAPCRCLQHARCAREVRRRREDPRAEIDRL